MVDYLTRRHHRARLVRDLLRAEILEGRYVTDELPPEDEIARRHRVGRNVVREALSLLVSERLIRRVQGRGTSSTAHVLVHSLNSLRGIAEDGRSNISASTFTYRLLSWELVRPSLTVATQLGVDPDGEVIMWERLTVGLGPLVLWTSYLPSDRRFERPPDVSEAYRGGTFAYFESFGLDIEVAHVRTGAARADAGTAELLGTSEGEPVMVQHRRTQLTDGTVIEVAIGYYRSDLIFLSNDFRRPS